MRPHSRYSVDARWPQAIAQCDRCNDIVQHNTLRWQMRWRGPKLANTGALVCEKCYDLPNEQERTIVLPIDPVPIAIPRTVPYVSYDSPPSYQNFDPADMYADTPTNRGAPIGNLTLNAGLNAAFQPAMIALGSSVVPNSSGTTSKRTEFCAALVNSNSSFNTIGVNWNADPTAGITTTLSSMSTTQTHTASGFTAVAPSDQPFLSTGATSYYFQGSNNNATWTTISSGTTAGTNGEVLAVTSLTGAAYQYHRLALVGDGISVMAVASLIITVSDWASPEV